MINVIFCGDRNWKDCDLVHRIIYLVNKKYGPIKVIEGEARGADTCAKLAAIQLGIPFEGYKPDWRIGPGGGPVRNKKMLTEEKPTITVGFHDNIMESTGTIDMLKKSAQAQIPTFLVTHKGWEWFSTEKEGFDLNE